MRKDETDLGPGCDWLDGVITLIVGCSLLGVSLVPSFAVAMDLYYPDVARSRSFVGGCVVWSLGVILFSFGFACAENSIWTVQECDRFRKWNHAVTLLVLGWSFFLLGSLAISYPIFPEVYWRICKE